MCDGTDRELEQTMKHGSLRTIVMKRIRVKEEK